MSKKMKKENVVMYENKIFNLHESIKKKDDKIKAQASVITSLEKKYIEAKYKAEESETIKDKYVNSIMSLRDNLESKLDKMSDVHERQMKIAESEIKRLNTIIDFLYMRGRV